MIVMRGGLFYNSRAHSRRQYIGK